jgi:hypothetical protein
MSRHARVTHTRAFSEPAVVNVALGFIFVALFVIVED